MAPPQQSDADCSSSGGGREVQASSSSSSPGGPKLGRTFEFWTKAVAIYGSYKVSQLRECAMRAMRAKDEEIESMWEEQNTRAGEDMYNLCVGLRGFYLKVQAAPQRLLPCPCMHARFPMQA